VELRTHALTSCRETPIQGDERITRSGRGRAAVARRQSGNHAEIDRPGGSGRRPRERLERLGAGGLPDHREPGEPDDGDDEGAGVEEDGRPVATVDQTSAAVREAFARDVLGMAPTAAFAQAEQAAASGRGEPPVSVASDREVLAFVRLKPGAIGYVSPNAVLQGVKVVTVGARPGEKGADALQPLQVGGAVKAPSKVVDVRPSYPELARQARAQGMVEVEIVVGADGDVEQARVTKSIPLLDKAALDAVRKWKYAPTVVNGVAVPVKMSVGLAFGM
jgi:TonB family protein